MKRKITQQMLEWKERSNGQTALLIEGARRVGKSYSAQAFARDNYRSYIMIDFNAADRKMRDLFQRDLRDLDSLYFYLQAYSGVRLYPRQSAVILDEVQLFPRARAAVKFLVEDGRFDVIETGSLMSIRENVKDIVIPSEERHIELHPMQFEEFLWACGNDTLMDFIRDRFRTAQPMGAVLHRKAMELFRQYMIVGGMPQSVLAFVGDRDLVQVDQLKRQILELYRADMQKHATRYALKVESMFDDISGQLQRHERRFQLSDLRRSARFRDYENALFWLTDAMIANACWRATAPTVGLRLNRDRTSFKLYMADTGLLVSQAFDENALAAEAIHEKLLSGTLEVNLGMITENMVAQILRACSQKLYFYSNASRTDAASRMEIDFMVSSTNITARHNISPIEVKSGKRYRTSSLEKFRKKFAEQTGMPYVVHMGDFEIRNGITFLPIYMLSCLFEAD